MNYTPNYNLNQWEAGDRVQRTDFNADNAKLDAALASLAATPPLRYASGTYTGTGGTSNHIEMGFTPKYAQVVQLGSTERRLHFYGPTYEFCDTTTAVGPVAAGSFSVSATDSGLSISVGGTYWEAYQKAIISCNSNNVKYAWFALG